MCCDEGERSFGKERRRDSSLDRVSGWNWRDMRAGNRPGKTVGIVRTAPSTLLGSRLVVSVLTLAALGAD